MRCACVALFVAVAVAVAVALVLLFPALALYDMTPKDPSWQKWADAATLFGFYLAFQTFSALALLTRHYKPQEDATEPNFDDRMEYAPAYTSARRNNRASFAVESAPLLLEFAPAASNWGSAPVQHVLSFLHLTYTVRVTAKAARSDSGSSDGGGGGGGGESWLSSLFHRPHQVEKTLLNDICGVVVTGQLVALMGTSGAGKSTLLDVLAQKKTTGKVSGSILWDGQPVPADFSKLVGYVEQFDSLAPQATVRESLFFSGRLRLDPRLSDREVSERVDSLLVTLELQAVAHRKIGSQEAGDLLPPEIRKKVAIAIELMNQPQVLFLGHAQDN